MFYKYDKYCGRVDWCVDEWILKFTRPLYECLRIPNKRSDVSESYIPLTAGSVSMADKGVHFFCPRIGGYQVFLWLLINE